MDSAVNAAHLVDIVQVAVRAAGGAEAPPARPTEKNYCAGRQAAVLNVRANSGRFGAKSCHFLKHTEALIASMLHHCAMQFFDSASAFAPLKIHDGISAMGHGLPALAAQLAGSLEAVVGRPVLLAGALLQEPKRLPSFQAAHQAMVEGNIGRHRVPSGVAVERNHVQLLGPFVIVQRKERAHHVGGDGHCGAVLADGRDLGAAGVQKLFRLEPSPVQRRRLMASHAVDMRRLNLRKAAV